MPDLEIILEMKVREYQRPFKRSLQTAHGEWTIRRGMLVCIETTNGETGYGEIAPLFEFGSETLAEAKHYASKAVGKQSRRKLEQFLRKAPAATAFGVWSALQDLDRKTGSGCNSLKTSGLMALDPGWQQAIEHARSMGTAAFKIKVGIGKRDTERGLLADILQSLKDDEQVRLDANMSWDFATFSDWSNWLANTTDKVQYIEEPLQPSFGDVHQLSRLASISPLPLALDESLSRHGLAPWLNSNWPGFWIIKPSILGIPTWLDKINPAKVVLSSVFETAIGMRAILSIARPFEGTCHGMGTGAYFNDGLSPVPVDGSIRSPKRKEVAAIWNQLSKT